MNDEVLLKKRPIKDSGYDFSELETITGVKRSKCKTDQDFLYFAMVAIVRIGSEKYQALEIRIRRWCIAATMAHNRKKDLPFPKKIWQI